MESADRFPGSPAKARSPGRAGEQVEAELSFESAEPPDEEPTTAAELIPALLPLGDPSVERGDPGARGARWLVSLRRLSPAAAWMRIRDKPM